MIGDRDGRPNSQANSFHQNCEFACGVARGYPWEAAGSGISGVRGIERDIARSVIRIGEYFAPLWPSA